MATAMIENGPLAQKLADATPTDTLQSDGDEQPVEDPQAGEIRRQVRRATPTCEQSQTKLTASDAIEKCC